MPHNPLTSTPPRTRSWISYGAWTLAVFLFAIGMVSFVIRSYSVHGISMEPTLRSGDVVLTNKIPYTLGSFTGKPHTPSRGSLVVFKNPFYNQEDPDMFIVKRVVGLPGDRVVIRDGRITVFPAGVTPFGFNPDAGIDGPQNPTSGTVDLTVPDNELFVVGDNRAGQNSLDSRNGMSTVPLREVKGTVVMRLWPLNHMRFF